MKKETFEKLAQTYMDMIYRVAYSWTKNAEDANDVKQNAVIYFMKDDKAYSLSGFDSKLSADEWFEMAEELIN